MAVSSYRSATLAKLDTVDENGLTFTKLTVRPVVEVAAAEDQSKVVSLLSEAKEDCLIIQVLNVPVQIEPAVSVAKTTPTQVTGLPKIRAEVR